MKRVEPTHSSQPTTEEGIMATVISAPAGNGGVADYADLLAAKLDANRIEVSSSNGPLSSLLTALRISATVRSGCINIQFSYSLFGPHGVWTPLFFIPLLLVTRLTGVPIVLAMHEVWDEQSVRESIIRQAYVELIHTVLQYCTDVLVLLSESSYNGFIGHEQAKSSNIFVIPHGVPESQTKRLSRAEARDLLNLSPERFVVSLVGFINERKNPGAIIEAAASLNATVLLAGGFRSNPSPAIQESLADAPPNVQVTGVLTEREFHAAFVASDVIVLPYKDINQSGILNWCAAYRVPTVTSSVPYFDRINAEYDCLVQTETTSLQEEVKRLLDSPQTRTELSKRMAQYAESESIDTVAEAYRTLHADLINSSR
jgi:glycosyltransferase involved in cell wall biosynthesis